MNRNAGLAAVMVFAISLISQLRAYSNPTAPTAAPSTDFSATDPVALKLTTMSRVVKLGEPILIKVEIVNRSSQGIVIPTIAPWEAVKINILAGKKALLPTTSIAPFRAHDPFHVLLRSGETRAFQFRTTSSFGSTDFHPISDWGYQHLPPGHYTITASPLFVGVVAAGPTHNLLPISAENRSNSLSVEIEPQHS